MKIVEVATKELEQEFLMLPVRLYKNEPHWIRPLDKDILTVFDKQKNKAFRHGECQRWLLYSENNEVIGRVSAFVNQKTVLKGNDQPTGGMGFFECINDKSAAFMLFDQCREWLASRGMEAMDGPVNFGTRDRWWGLLIEGFDQDPNYQCNYNFPYYKEFFEEYGFQVYFYQLTFHRPVEGPLSPKLWAKAEMVAKDPDYEIRYLRKDEISKLPEYILKIYNKAWANRYENPELSMAQAELIVKQMKPILDRRLLYFGFYKGEPVSFFLSLPEINQIFKYVDGKLDLIGKIKFLWHTLMKNEPKSIRRFFLESSLNIRPKVLMAQWCWNPVVFCRICTKGTMNMR